MRPDASEPGLEAEQALLGGLLADGTALHRVNGLRAEHFGRKDHRRIFAAVLDCAEDAGVVDAALVADRIARNVGDAELTPYIAALADNNRSTRNLEHYAKLVREQAQRRELAALGTDLAARACTPGADLVALRRDMAARLNALHFAQESRFRPMWVNDATTTASADYMVKGLLDRGALGVIYGPPSCGKSFFAIDLAWRIALGIEWRGRRVKGGLVSYIAAEGGEGILRRFVAWRGRYMGETREGRVPLVVLTRAPNLLRVADVDALIAELRSLGSEIGLPVAAVVIDTLSRAMPGGDENRSEDMTQAIDAAAAIRDELGAATLLIHHSGKDAAKGARGHSSLLAAADVMIALGDGVATVEKMRDGQTRERFAFALDAVDLGTDSDGDRIGTCVLRHIDAGAPPGRAARPLTGVGKIALAALDEVIEAHGETLPGTSIIPAGTRAARIGHWRERFRLRYGTDPDGGAREADALKKAFLRAREQLAAADAVAVADPYAWITR